MVTETLWPAKLKNACLLAFPGQILISCLREHPIHHLCLSLALCLLGFAHPQWTYLSLPLSTLTQGPHPTQDKVIDKPP